MMGERYVKTRHFTTKGKGRRKPRPFVPPTWKTKGRRNGSGEKLYALIWEAYARFQMTDAEVEKTTASISINNSSRSFIATGEIIKFDGFLRIYKRISLMVRERGRRQSGLLPPLTNRTNLAISEILATERFLNVLPDTTRSQLG